MPTKISSQLRIAKSLPKKAGLLAIGVAFISIGGWFVRGGVADSHGSWTIYFGWLIVLLFGLFLFRQILEFVFGDRTPVTFSSNGLTDTRKFKKELPWSKISRVSVLSVRGTSMIRLQLNSDNIGQYHLTPSAKFTRWINRPFGLDGLYLTSVDLDVSFPDLWDLMQSYLAQFNPSALGTE